MKRGLAGGLLALSLIGGLGACGRHVVLDPETVERVNDRAWTVRNEPGRTNVSVSDAGASVLPPATASELPVR